LRAGGGDTGARIDGQQGRIAQGLNSLMMLRSCFGLSGTPCALEMCRDLTLVNVTTIGATS
jgi:hypothetical protein